jgi:hypothetical protein
MRYCHQKIISPPGQLEVTMMNSFCAAANLKTFLQSPRCPDCLKPCAPIVEQCYGGDNRGTLMNDMRSPDNDTLADAGTDQPWEYDGRKTQPLESDIYDALVAVAKSGKVSPHREAVLHTRRIIRGLQYTDYRSGKKNCNIYFRSETGERLVPGRIRQIFSIPKESQDGITKECLLLAVQKYKPIDQRLDDPFRRFEDFGASLWSSSVGRVEILFPSDDFFHGIVRQWNGVDVLVMRPLNRVSCFINELNVQTHRLIFAGFLTDIIVSIHIYLSP